MSRRGLWIALIVSLAVNLFVLGGLAGAALRGGLRPPEPPPPGPPRLTAAGAALSDPQREAWQAAIRQGAETSRPKLEQARALRREAWRGLSIGPVDVEATLVALNRSRALEMQARSEMDRAVVGFAATLPADDRRKLAEVLSRARRHPPGEWSRDRGHPGPQGGGRHLPER
ncbi:periplasmic heavy metal sensor [Phenylobacterium sp. LjRoot219]|uniref:periplasmic heavy metal sensor n=1 Tax=Phenylobacterium sp. LjRoot219 TaxID=3342283 RepID=UPI003ECF307C